jgi:hypothetical protein
MDTINTVFASIGNANGMRMPKSTNNLEPLAWDLFIARHVLSLAEKQKEKAETAAVKAGVIIDKTKNPKPAGTREVVYNGDIVSIMLEVRSGAERVSTTRLVAYLEGKGVSRSLLDEAVKAATDISRAAHVFTPILITSESAGK